MQRALLTALLTLSSACAHVRPLPPGREPLRVYMEHELREDYAEALIAAGRWWNLRARCRIVEWTTAPSIADVRVSLGSAEHGVLAEAPPGRIVLRSPGMVDVVWGVLIHEIGHHLLGPDHALSDTNVMAPTVGERERGIREDLPPAPWPESPLDAPRSLSGDQLELLESNFCG